MFDRRLFVHDESSDTLTCPTGKVLVRKQVLKRKKGILYTARADDCGPCPLRARCTTKRVRLVTCHQYEDALQRMHTRATPELMRLRRCTVEYPFGLLKFHILEKPRLLMRGLWGSGTEMALATLAYNLKRVMAVLGNGGVMARLALA